MKRTILIIWMVLTFGCKTESKNEVIVSERIDSFTSNKKNEDSIDSLKLNINFAPKGDYASILNKIRTDRAYFEQQYHSNTIKSIDSASKYIYSKLLNDIVPHWYGTDWDFNGHTDTPNDGEIACGYFVSTTLKHLGFNLNRYKMAQQAGLVEAQMLQPKSELKIYSGLSFKDLNEKINAVYKDGLYFVGLDNHVGYVLVKNKILYFLHSSYCDDKVVMEFAETSPCFMSHIYVFSEITTNEKLIKKWILNERLIVPTS